MLDGLRRASSMGALLLTVTLAAAMMCAAQPPRTIDEGQYVGINDPRLAAEALVERNPLTDRQREILVLAEGGASSGEIATMLELSKGTGSRTVW